MRMRLWAALVLFLLLTLSTMSYAAFVAYRTYEIDSDEGTTSLTGVVTDSEENPLEGVKVTLDDTRVLTGTDGVFLLEDVNSGIVDVEFYKEGYVPLELTYLAYPFDEVKDDLDDSPNNISNEQDLVLLLEMETSYPFDELENGTVTVIFDSGDNPQIAGRTMIYGNGSGQKDEMMIGNGSHEIEIEGDGTIEFAFEGIDQGLIWRQFPGAFVNITEKLESLVKTGSIHGVTDAELSITVDDDGYSGDINITVVDPLLGPVHRSLTVDGSGRHDVKISVNEGVSTVRVTGRGIRDREYDDIVVVASNTTELEITVTEANAETLLEGLDLSLNYVLSAIYGAISLLFILGAYLIKRGKRWTIPFIIALIGFLIRGFPIAPFNVNLLLASIIIILIFISREDFAERENARVRSRS